MEAFTAFVSWPSAPLTDSLVRNALAALDPQPTLVTTLPAAPERLLQWSTYDALDHDLTHSHSQPSASRVLASAYTIRKALIRKHYLSRCVNNFLVKHPDSLLKIAVPRTWELELSFADELDELWADELWDLAQEIGKEDGTKWWILKPGMADRGMGLRLFHSKEDLQHIFEEFEGESEDDSDTDTRGDDHGASDTGVMASQLRHFVVQEYLSSPLLLDPLEAPLDGAAKPDRSGLRGHKFHLRVYCVASGAIKVYFYTRILALFSAVPYAPPARSPGRDVSHMDLAAHLTNTSLQTDRGEAGVRLLDELAGCHILSSDPATTRRRRQPRPPRAMGQIIDVDNPATFPNSGAEYDIEDQCLTDADIGDLKDQIAAILAETFKAAVEMSVHFQPIPNAFELYGVDFVVTHKTPGTSTSRFQVNLLEINAEPAIELTGPRLTWILQDLFSGIAKTCVAPFFTKDGRETADIWQVGQTREHLRKCLDFEVRKPGGW